MIRVLAVVLVHAGVQVLLVLGDPVPGPDAGFVLRAVASLVALLVALVLLAPASRRRVPVAAGLVVLAAVAALVSELLAVLVVAAGGLVLGHPSWQRSVVAVTGRQRRRFAVTGWWGLAARAVTVVVLVVLCRAVALLAGLLLAGPVAAAVTWVVAGLVAALVLRCGR